MALSLGEVLVKIGGDVSGLNDSLKEGEVRIDAFTGLAKTGAATIGVFIAAGAAAAGTMAAFAASAIATADHFQNLSDKTAISAETLQAWDIAGKQMGISAEQIGNATLKLGKNIFAGGQEVQKALDAIGTSAAQLKGLSPEQQFNTIANAIRDVKDPTEQAAIAMTLFGRAGAEILPAIRNGLTETADEAKALGFVISNEMIAATDAFGDRVDMLGSGFGALVDTIGGTIATNELLGMVVESLIQTVSEMINWVKQNESAIQSWINTGIIFAIEFLRRLLEIIGGTVAGIGFLIGAVGKVIEVFGQFTLAQASVLDGMVGVAQAVVEFGAGIPGLGAALIPFQALLGVADGVTEAMKTSANAVVETGKGIQGFGDSVTGAGAKVVGIANQLGQYQEKLLSSVAAGDQAAEATVRVGGAVTDFGNRTDEAGKKFEKLLASIQAGTVEGLTAEMATLEAALMKAAESGTLTAEQIQKYGKTFSEAATQGAQLGTVAAGMAATFNATAAAAAAAGLTMSKATKDAAALSVQIQSVGGASALSRKALEDAAKQFVALEQAGVQLNDTQRETIALNAQLTASEKAVAKGAEEQKKAQEQLTNTIDDLKNKAGILTETAGREFQNFQNAVTAVMQETGGVMTKEMENALREMAQALADQFPALADQINSFLDSIGSDVSVKVGGGTDAIMTMGQALSQVTDLMSAFGIEASSSMGQFLALASQAGPAIETLAADLGEGGAGMVGGAIGQGDYAGAATGIMGGIAAIGSATSTGSTGARAGKGAIAGATAGAQVAGPIGAAVGAAAGAIVGFFRGRAMEKAQKEIEEVVGARVSEALANAIRDAADELDLSVGEASLLHLGDIIAEVGIGADLTFQEVGASFSQLITGIVDGTLPAEQATLELGEAFAEMAAQTVVAGEVASGALIGTVRAARAAGLEVPEITAFVADQLAQAAEGIAAVIGQAIEGEGGEVTFGGIQVASVEDAQAQATIFAATFFATLEEQGLLAAVDVFGPAFEEMKAKFQDFGLAIDFGGVERLFELAADPQFRPLLEGVEGLKQAMAGLANAGYMTRDSFDAFQQQGAAAFDQLVAAGLTEQEALLQIAPLLQAQIDAAAAYGFELDENTQALIAQAEASGIGFTTDPQQRMVDVLELIAQKLGATAEELGAVGTAAGTTATAVGESTIAATEQIVVLGETAGERIAAAGGYVGEAVAGMQETIAAAAEGASNSLASTGDSAMEVASVTDTAATEIEARFGTMSDVTEAEFAELAAGAVESYATIGEGSVSAVAAVQGVGGAALGAAANFRVMADAANQAANAAAGAAAGGGGGGGGDNGGGGGGGKRPEEFQFGGLVTGPTLGLLGEAGPELVLPLANAARAVEVAGAVSAGREAPVPMQLVIQIGSETFLAEIEDATRTNKLRIHERSVTAFGD